MSSATTKNLILAQRKPFSTDTETTPALVGEVSHSDSLTTIKVEIPGIDPSTVEVGCEHNIIRVFCAKGEYVYSVEPTIDTSKIKAEIQWGLLTLTIPAPPAPAAHSIKISIHDAIKSVKSKFTSEE